MTIFDFVEEPVQPGDWVTLESGKIGGRLTFEEIAESIGKMIVLDMSTQSHAWYKAVLVEKIVFTEIGRRLIYYDGSRQRGSIDEIYFSGKYMSKIKAYELN